MLQGESLLARTEEVQLLQEWLDKCKQKSELKEDMVFNC